MSGGPMTEAMYYVLLALHRPAHGYQLMQQIARASRGRVQMGPGTLYGVLTRMEKEGLIVLSENDGRRKTYLLTNAGMEALRAEYSRLRAMVRDGAWIGEGGTNEKTQLEAEPAALGPGPAGELVRRACGARPAGAEGGRNADAFCPGSARAPALPLRGRFR